MKKIYLAFVTLVSIFSNAQTSFVSGVPYFYQYNNSINPGGSCQNTSISMVIKFYGGTNETPDAVSAYYGTSQAQSPSGLQQVFNSEAIYFNIPQRDIAHTNGTFNEIQTLLAAGKPVIVHGYFTGYGHVMVITGYNGATYTCNDPAGKWSQTYQYGGYSQANSTEGHSVTYSKSNFENAIGPNGTIWYHEIINTATTSVLTGTVDIIAPTSLANTSNINQYKTANFQISFTDTDNNGGSGINKSFYSVLDWNGTEWRANQNNGFLCDNFDNAIHSDWSINAGSWNIASNILTQSDNSNLNTAFNTTLNQSLSNRYIYHWLGKIDGTGVNKSAGIHIMSDNVTQSNRGNSYLILFKSDASKIEIYKTINNVLGSPIKTISNVTINSGTWYDYKVMYDRTTGAFNIWMNDMLVGDYTDTSSPITNGTGFSFKTSQSIYSINNLKAYRSRLVTNANVSIGNTNSDVRYQSPDPSIVSYSCKIKTLCVDNSMNISSVGNLDLLIDWTPPSMPSFVYDGLSSDISTSTSTNSISSNFDICSDINSGIKSYYYFIGTSPNDSSILGATNNGLNTSFTKTGLSLINGTTYYVSIYSVNNAGLKSSVVSTNGQLVNLTTGLKDEEFLNELKLYPNPSNGNFLINTNFKSSTISMQITNMIGEVVDEVLINSDQYFYENNNISKGMYIVKILDDKKILGTRKIIIQ